MAMARSRTRQAPSASIGSRGSPHPPWFLSLTAALPAFFVCPVWAAKWDIVPRLTVQESYTDNVGLAPEGFERGEFVTQVRPGVSIRGGGPRLRLNADYSADLIYRSQQESREVRHRLNADGRAEVLHQLFFVDASASVSQQNISLTGPQAQSNINTTGNLADVSSFQVSPYLRHTFGASAQGEARYTYSRVTTDATNSLSNSNSNRVDLRLSSGPAYKLYTWNLAYNREVISYAQSQQPDVTTQTITAGGRRLITPQLYLTSSIGYEDADYLSIGEPPQGFFWNTGFEYTPTDRTRIAASTGRRYFGKNNFFQFNHRTRLTVWTAGYSEGVTTTRTQFLLPSIMSTADYIDTLFLTQFPDPVLRSGWCLRRWRWCSSSRASTLRTCCSRRADDGSVNSPFAAPPAPTSAD